MAEELKLVIKVDKDGLVSVEELQKKIVKTDEAVKKADKSWQDWGAAIKGSAFVTGLNQGLELLGKAKGLVEDIVKLMNEGAQANRAEQFFKTMANTAGANASGMLEQLRGLSGGVVDDDALIGSANKFLQAGASVEATLAGIGLAYKYSMTTGKEFGEGLEAAYGSLVNGSSEASKKLGLFVDENQALATYAFQKYGSVDAVKYLTEEQKALALQAGRSKAALEALGDGFIAQGTKSEIFTAQIKNLKDSMAKSFGGIDAPNGLPKEFIDAFAKTDLAGRVFAIADAREAAQRRVNAALEDELKAQAKLSEYTTTHPGERNVRVWELERDARDAAKVVQDLTEKLYDHSNTSRDALRKDAVELQGILAGQTEAVKKLDMGLRVRDTGAVNPHIEVLKQTVDWAQRAATAYLYLGDTASAEALQRTADAAKAEIQLLQEQQAAYAAVTLEMVKNKEARLAFLVREGQGQGDEAQELVKLIPLYKEATKGEAQAAEAQHKYNEQLIKFVEIASKNANVDFARFLGLKNPEDIREAADLYGNYRREVEEFNKALEHGTDADQTAALDELQAAGNQLVDNLRLIVSPELMPRVDTLSGQIADNLARASVNAAAIPGALEMSLQDLQDIWLELETNAIIAGGGAKPPPKKSGGGGRRIQDISDSEAASRMAILAATTEEARIAAEYAEALRKAEADLKASGGKAMNSYVVGVAEATKRHNEETRALTEKNKQLALEAANRQKAEDIGFLQAGTAANNKLAQERDRLGTLRGDLDEYEARRREIDRQEAEGGLFAKEQADVQRQILAHDLETRALGRKADAIRDVGDALVLATSNANQWATAWGQQEVVSKQMEMELSALAKFGDSIGLFIESSGKGADSMKEAGGAMAMGFAGMAASMQGSVGKSALIMGLMATANAIYYAVEMPWKAPGYAAAAIAYYAVAAEAGLGSGKKKSGGVARSLGTSAPSAASGGAGNTYNVYLSGKEIIKSTDEELGVGIARALASAQYSGSTIPKGMVR